MMVYSSINTEHHFIDEYSKNFYNCLYTEDIPITDMVKETICNLNYQMIQVPHHGSKHNFDPVIYHCYNTAFISVGTKNRYNHPDKVTWDHIAQICSKCRIVTEESKASEYHIHIKI